MDEILRNLQPGARVLDVGSLTGSFPQDRCPGSLVVRLDLERPASGAPPGFVQADATRLPFPDRSFHVVISNHSLEHIHNFPQALTEIGRILRPDSALYVAVPDASTFSDRLYRWMYHGGGHINPFCSATGLADQITRATGLPLIAMRPLYSSFEYLNRYYFGPRPPRRLMLVGNGTRRSIMVLSYLTRLVDRAFRTRASAYGWAFYFGSVGEAVETAPWSNVCIACGSASPAAWLEAAHLVRRRLLLFRSFSCPSCNVTNFFTPDPG